MKTYTGPEPLALALASNQVRGAWGEAAFLAKALYLGFTVCRPFCDNHQFDFLLISPSGAFSRVQVKSTWFRQKSDNGYRLFFSRGGRPYTPEQIDFLAGYIGPEDAWYIIPVQSLTCHSGAFYPHVPHTRSHWERYREAWRLLET